jgi:group I intron endonuclease
MANFNKNREFDRIVYKTTNIITGEFYIGQDSYNRSHYLGSGKILKRKIKEYGRENFMKEILEYCNTSTELDKMEIYWINKLNAIEEGYNILKGGKGNSYHEYINKMKSVSSHGCKNPMYNRNVLEIWIAKYGKDKAKKLWDLSNKRRSINGKNKGVKKVKVYNSDNIFIGEFNSIKDASIYTTVGYKYIKKSNVENKKYKNFYFKY